jgi:hypothetical protein
MKKVSVALRRYGHVQQNLIKLVEDIAGPEAPLLDCLPRTPAELQDLLKAGHRVGPDFRTTDRASPKTSRGAPQQHLQV